MTLRQLTEHNLEFLSLKGGCTSSSESTNAKCHIVGHHVSRLNFSAAHHGLCPENCKSSDTTGHDTGLWTGLSLARGSGYCFDFPTAFLFDGMTEFVKG